MKVWKEWNWLSFTDRNFFNTSGLSETTNKIFESADDYLDHSEIGIYKGSSDFFKKKPKTIAYTVLRHDEETNGRLVSADIIFNDAYDFTTDGSGVDFQTTLVHELGHLIGLPHNDRLYAVMKPCIAKGEIKRRVTYLDRRELSKIYGRNGLQHLHELRNERYERMRSRAKSEPHTGEVVHALQEDGRCLEYRNGVLESITEVL